MKNIILYTSIIASISMVSCKKEDKVVPQSSTPTSTINVEYRVTNESGNVEITYLKPDDNGTFESETETVSRTYYAINFTCKKGNLLSVEAANVLPARKTVTVQIFVNGVLFKEATSYDPSQKALAAGNY
jgi:predicted nucleic acid binding AN1-type Zn finger protein